MSLRPRYSLLTLLVITALVAGGVKLWYGPHHDVTEWNDQIADHVYEYSYTRDWRGNYVVHGPTVTRTFVAGKLEQIKITYVRHGNPTNWVYGCYIKKSDLRNEPLVIEDRKCTLSKQEIQALHHSRDVELLRIAEEGIHYEFEYEGERVISRDL